MQLSHDLASHISNRFCLMLLDFVERFFSHFRFGWPGMRRRKLVLVYLSVCQVWMNRFHSCVLFACLFCLFVCLFFTRRTGPSGLVVTFVDLIAPHASVLTILAISFERYYAICQPFKAGYICTKSRAMFISLFTWICAGLLTRSVSASLS